MAPTATALMICTTGRKSADKPGGPVGGPVHLARKLAELVQVLLLAAQGLDHAHAGDVLVVGAGDLGVDLAHLAVLDQDPSF